MTGKGKMPHPVKNCGHVEGEIKKIIVDKWHPLIHNFRSYTTTKDALGQNFRFDEKLQ
ncbi:hypothetical protein [Lactococcus ileimucosae]|uniref:hypothetical protein n=1 Tax=Lactococcus ileimucosae TaxID=2941329 RepID=UPI0035171DCE